ncbi:MAG: hypothetical protein HC893_08080 [Chloroflexaceae bacterium]|nr:hypothetical protein [Chloroflexaceae bacterium]
MYPIWERQIPHLLAQDPTADVYTPYRLLIASEAFVNTLDPRVKSQLETLTHRTHDWLGAMAYDIPLQAFSAAHAILNATNTILRPHLLELISQETFVAHLTDDDLDVLALDYAGAAMKAYTTLDPEKPAMEPSEPVAMAYFQQQQAFWTAMEMVSFQRRREFWSGGLVRLFLRPGKLHSRKKNRTVVHYGPNPPMMEFVKSIEQSFFAFAAGPRLGVRSPPAADR